MKKTSTVNFGSFSLKEARTGNTISYRDFYTFSTEKVIVNNNTTIVQIKATPKDAVYDSMEFLAAAKEAATKLKVDILEEQIFTGIATCNETDIFNPMVGRDLAERRALKKAFNYVENIFIEMYLHYTKVLDSMLHLKMYYAERQLKCAEYITSCKKDTVINS